MPADLLQSYYAAFNRADSVAMLDFLTEDVVHEPSQGTCGKEKPLSPCSSTICTNVTRKRLSIRSFLRRMMAHTVQQNLC